MSSLTNPSPAGPGERFAGASVSRKSTRRWILGFALVAGAVGGWALYQAAVRPAAAARNPQIASIPTATISAGAIERTIMASGQTAARNFASIKVPQQRGRGSGVLTLIKLIEGGVHVKKGEVVAQLDPESLLQQIDDFEDTLDQSQASLRTLKARQAVDWENLQQTVRAAKAARDRAAHDFSAAEVKTEVEREILKLALEEAEATYKQQLEALPLKQISFQADLRMSEISYQQQLNRRERLRNDLKNYTFTAPMDGLVVIQTFNRSGSSDMVQYQVGDQVQPGMEILRIVDTSSMQLQGFVNQTEASEIRVGQPAKVTLDAFPGLVFEGRVYSLGAIAVQSWRENYYVRTVPVTVAIQGSDPRLIPDMTGAAAIQVARRDNVLMVPLQAVRKEGGKDVVRVLAPAGFETRQVALGVRNATHAEVLSGLQPGDRVALR